MSDDWEEDGDSTPVQVNDALFVVLLFVAFILSFRHQPTFSVPATAVKKSLVNDDSWNEDSSGGGGFGSSSGGGGFGGGGSRFGGGFGRGRGVTKKRKQRFV